MPEYDQEIDECIRNIAAIRDADPTGRRPVLLLVCDRETSRVCGESRVISAGDAAARVVELCSRDPVFKDGGRALRKMRVGGVVAHCTRLGVPHLRPGTKRHKTKASLVESILALHRPN